MVGTGEVRGVGTDAGVVDVRWGKLVSSSGGGGEEDD